VALNQGGGAFAAPVTFDTEGRIPAVLGQLDQDGKLDLLLAGDGLVNALLNRGDGTFDAVVDTLVNGTSVAVGDIDGDGKLDLVVQDQASTGVSVVRGHGDITFGSPAIYPTGEVIYAEGLNVGPLLADIDGDGKLDVVVENQDGVSVLMNRGDGSFASPINLVSAPPPFPFAMGDLDGDGLLDIVIGAPARPRAPSG